MSYVQCYCPECGQEYAAYNPTGTLPRVRLCTGCWQEAGPSNRLSDQQRHEQAALRPILAKEPVTCPACKGIKGGIEGSVEDCGYCFGQGQVTKDKAEEWEEKAARLKHRRMRKQ